MFVCISMCVMIRKEEKCWKKSANALINDML